MGRREVRSTPAPEEPFRPRRRNEQGNKNNCAASGPVHRVRSLAFPTAPEADVLSALRPHALPDRQDHLAGVDPDAQRARRGPGNLLLQHQRRSLGLCSTESKWMRSVTASRKWTSSEESTPPSSWRHRRTEPSGSRSTSSASISRCLFVKASCGSSRISVAPMARACTLSGKKSKGQGSPFTRRGAAGSLVGRAVGPRQLRPASASPRLPEWSGFSWCRCVPTAERRISPRVQMPSCGGAWLSFESWS